MDKIILDKLKELQQKANEIIENSTTLGNTKEEKFDFSNLTVEEKHKKYIDWSIKMKPHFKDRDVVEVEENDTLEKVEKLVKVINPELSKRVIAFSHNSVVGHILGRSLVNTIFV